ncbi:MAG TPA: beta-galactosidase [Terracidiphilus sp.]|nr:beta-galactosidase [Terracidiphilus sp.]
MAGFPATAAAQPSARGALNLPDEPLVGAAWYPEQWPEQRWDADLTLMQQAGFNVVRVGEFAWSRMEPREGVYDFDWLERAVRLAERHRIYVILGTPTDAPPAWLTEKYPDTLRVDAGGRRAEHGGRRQFSYSSPRYRIFCRQIAARLAARFGHDPDVIGWQIGNEYTDESYDAAAREQFHAWLRARYGTLDALNRAWTTAYWSQTYDNWNEIPLNDAPGNPGLMLAHRRFVTATWLSFQQVQIDAVRPRIDPRQFITTNIGGLGWSDHFDHYRISEPLTLAAWDDYVGEGHLDAMRNAAMHDFVRGWKRRNFLVMETQPGFVNWAKVNNSLDKGETRAMAWQAIGHGAEGVIYWQWRDALNGQEQYHGAIVGPDGTPLPIYPEIRQTAEEFHRAQAVLAGTAPVSDVAIVLTYDSRWALDFQPHTDRYDQLQVLLDFYRPLAQIAQSVDIVEASAPLNGYKLVIAPALNVLPPQLAQHLLEYVRQGGVLLLGPRSGMKDENNSLNVQRQPGPLVDALGGRVEQFYALENPVRVSGEFGSGAADIWAEMLSTRDSATAVPLHYGAGNDWLQNQPAMLERHIGKGALAYLGALLDPKLMRAAVAALAAEAGVQPVFGTLPDGVEVCRRIGAGRDVFVIINHGRADAELHLPERMRIVLGDAREGPARADVLLPAQGVMVVAEQN